MKHTHQNIAVNMSKSVTTTAMGFVSVALTCVQAFIMLAIFIIALITLRSMKSDETPFNRKNVKRLKAMAILLVIYEPYLYLYTFILGKLHPIVIGDFTVEPRSTLSGMFVIAGIVVYCVALVFEYGISLQRQFDETL